jgi:DNA-binding GntR family transcriptional regulator
MYDLASYCMKCHKPILATRGRSGYARGMNAIEGLIDPLDTPPELPWVGDEGGICRRIRQDILSGRITGNERLKVADLAASYGTSTNPVREALHQLSGEGLVIISPNRGARVRRIDEAYVRDIYELSSLFEPYLIRWFVGICTDEDIARLEQVQDQIEALNFADNLRHSNLDQQFHQIMYERHYNRMTVELWWRKRTILTGINRDRGISLRRQREVLDEHRSLIAALRAHDEDRAAALIAQHVKGAGRHIIDWMRSERTGPD